MRSSALAQIMIAEALRACIRGVGLYAEANGMSGDEASKKSLDSRLNKGQTSLVRALAAINGVIDLDRELARICACGDLAMPISTYAEIAAREQRLALLQRSLGPKRTYLETAQQLIGVLPAAVLTGSDGRLLAPVRGHLLASDETRLQAFEARFERAGMTRNAQLLDNTEPAARLTGVITQPGQAQHCMTLLHSEAAAWRIVDTSDLANRLLVDRGMFDTFVQARKRARGVLRAHEQSEDDILQPQELTELVRWHRSLAAQLALLERVPQRGELARGLVSEGAKRVPLQSQAVELEGLLVDTLQVLRLWKVLGGAAGAKRRKRARTEWPRLVESLTELLRDRSALCLAAMSAIYGLSKSNFRALVGSDSA